MTARRPHLESALCLSLQCLLKQRLLVPGNESSGALIWRRGDREHVASVGYKAKLTDHDGTLTLIYTAEGKDAQDLIRLSSNPNHYGGRSWFMHCPETGLRARKLYKWQGLASFRHREAVRPRPTYASQRVSGSDRIVSQRRALRRKMGDELSNLIGGPIKPKGMRWATYDRYLARDAGLLVRMWRAWAPQLGRLGIDVPSGVRQLF